MGNSRNRYGVNTGAMMTQEQIDRASDRKRDLAKIEAELADLTGWELLAEASKRAKRLGYVYTGAPCDCADGGEYGHRWSCGLTAAGR